MSQSDTAASPAVAKPAHRDSNVLRWLTAYAVSLIGDGVYFMALGWAANRVADPAQVGMVMAAASVPRALLMLGGGVIADRLGPRRVVIGSDVARCVVILTTAALLVFVSPHLWLLITLALVFGTIDAVFMPAVGTLPPRITTANQLTRVQGMRSLALRIGNVTGPPLAGLMMGFGDVPAAFALAGALFALSLVLLLTVRIAPLPDREEESGTEGQPGSAWRDLIDGLRYISRHPIIGPLALSLAVTELAIAGPLNVGLVLLADDRGWGASGMGLIVSSFAAAAAASALLLTTLGRLPRAGAVQIASVFLASTGIAVIGTAPSLATAMLAAAVGGLGGGLAGALAFALTQMASTSAYLGRVTAVMSLSTFGLAPLSYPLVGAAISTWGLVPVYLGCGLLGMVGMVITLATTDVRRAVLPR